MGELIDCRELGALYLVYGAMTHIMLCGRYFSIALRQRNSRFTRSKPYVQMGTLVKIKIVIYRFS